MSAMWKDYSINYIKNNRSSSISVMTAAFFSAVFLSLLCSLFYNLWNYEVERLKLVEGDWQSRIVGEIEAEDLVKIQNFANIEKVVKNEALSNEQDIVVDLYFKNIWTILNDMPQIINLLEDQSREIIYSSSFDYSDPSSDQYFYHDSLLALYFIRDPQDTAPRAVFPFLFFIMGMACCSLIMIIHNSFAVSMNDRIHQFGMLSSIGATPKQIRICLLQEAAVLCAMPIFIGNLLGIGISVGIMKSTNFILENESGRMDAVWSYHPLIFFFTLLLTIFTIWISAWIPARKISRMTPLEAIKQTGERNLKKKQNSYILSFIFGIEGELAGNALKAQKKSLRTATLALSISFLAFSIMQSFFTLTKISQEITYFARYQDAWDIMITVKNTEIDAFFDTNGDGDSTIASSTGKDSEIDIFWDAEKLQQLSGVRSGTVYQKAAAKRMIREEELSEEVWEIGRLQNASERYVSALDGGWMVNVPIVIMDDASFLEYCKQIGVTPRLDGAVIINQINSNSGPNFRIRNEIPYLDESQNTTILRQAGKEDISAEIPVISYTEKLPVLREAYDEVDAYVLVHVLPVSVWKEIKGAIGGAEQDTFIRVLGKDGVTLEELREVENEISQILTVNYQIESENRIQDKINNDAMMDGMLLILGGFCVLLAMIGIGNVFSNTLGFAYQRKREFARYLSIGMSLEGIQKMFFIEALVMVGRPVLVMVPLTVIVTGVMIKVSYLEPMIFIREMPLIPIVGFLLAVFGIVGIAYYLGGRKVLRSRLVDALRDDTMM